MIKRNKKLSKKHTLRIAKLLQEAFSHHKAGRLHNAEALYKSILKKYPKHPDAMHLLGVITYQLGKYEIAVNLISDSIKIKPDNAQANYDLGNALIKLNRDEEAVTYYEKAIVIKPDYADAYFNLGCSFIDLGHKEKAKTCFIKAIAIKPNFANAYLHLVLVDPEQDKIPVIEALLSKSSASDLDITHSHYALGILFNNAKFYDKAFEHYLKANTLRRKTINYDSKKHSAFVDKQIQIFSKEYFQENMISGSNSELPVFILGMPRSGTSLVEQIISNHPQVYGAGELYSLPEIVLSIAKQFENSNQYPECIKMLNDSIVERFSVEYLKKISNYSPNAKRITDKMPANFFRIGIIKILFPQAKIIHCKRNALDTCTSIFLNYFAEGHEYSFDLSELGQYYLDYEKLMSHWHNLFPSQILDVQYEELVMNQESISHKLIEYIGLEWDEKCLEFHKNKRAVKTTSNLQVRKPIFKGSIGRWKKYEKELQPLIKILEQNFPA